MPSLQEHLHVNHEGDEETEASKVGLGVRPASRCHLLGCALRQVISHLSLSYTIGEVALLLLEGLLPFSADARQTDSTYKRPSQEFTKWWFPSCSALLESIISLDTGICHLNINQTLGSHDECDHSQPLTSPCHSHPHL